MKYWLFDVAGLSKLNVVSVTNPPLAISFRAPDKLRFLRYENE
jgi:hypothetical protein